MIVTGNLDGTVTSELFKAAGKLDAMRNDVSQIDTKLSDLSVMNGMLENLSDEPAQLGGIKNTLDEMKNDYASLRTDFVNLLNSIGKYIELAILRLAS